MGNSKKEFKFEIGEHLLYEENLKEVKVMERIRIFGNIESFYTITYSLNNKVKKLKVPESTLSRRKNKIENILKTFS